MEQEEILRLQRAMEAVEQACARLQTGIGSREADEALLMEFRKSSQPFKACQYILDHSRMALALFEAAATIQEAIIREWVLISPEEKTAIRTYCLQYVMVHVEKIEGYVLIKMLSVVATLLKRGWLEYSQGEKEAFFSEVHQAVTGAHGLAAQQYGLALLESLISEFSASTARPMGLPAEFHGQCRLSLELDYLQKFYAWAQDASLMVAGKAIEGRGESRETNICATAVRLMSQILNWEFHGHLTRGAGGVVVVGKNRASTLTSLFGREHSSEKRYSDHVNMHQLDQTWHDLLASPERVAWILSLYAHIHQNGNDWLDRPLAVLVRQLIVQLCSLSGQMFPSDGGATHEKHLQRLLDGILTWIEPPESVINKILAGAHESEMVDGCRALLAIATQCSPAAFDQLLKQSRTTGTLNFLSALTCGVIRVLGMQQSEELHWSEEVFDLLLEIWTVVLQPADLSRKVPLPPNGIEAASAVFQTYVEFEMRMSESSALDEDDVTEYMPASIEAREERLIAVALIARTAPSANLPLLTLLVSKCISGLRQSSSSEDRTRWLEQLYALTMISGHVLADSGEGETPMVPESILALCAEPAAHPAVVLSFSFIDLAQQSLDTVFRSNLLSPRLMEAVVWFFGRWADTYLMPADAGRGPSSTPSSHEGEQGVNSGIQFDGRNALNAAFGKDGGGTAVLEVLVRLAVTALTAWPGEGVLQETVCYFLLPALVRKRDTCSKLLSLVAWQELVAAFARQDQTLIALPAFVQRALSESLCRSALGMSNAEADQYVKNLLGSMVASLADFSGRQDLPSFSQQPDVIHQVCCVLERLRGAAKATLPRSQKAMYEVGISIMEPFLVFMKIYRNQPSVVYLVLKYVVTWVDAQVAFLEPKETAIVFNFCVKLLRAYSAHNMGKISVSPSDSLLSETQSEQYKDLRALLQLLTNLSSKDVIDFSHSDLENPDVAEVVYFGLNIITPLISLDLLKYPKLCRQYFTLLMHLLEVYPEKVAKLSPAGFSQITNTLEFGLRHQDLEVVTMTLTAIGAMATFHFQEVCKGQAGLGSHSQTGGDGFLSHFLKAIMHFLLFEDYSNDLVESASDALLPLVLCNPALYESLNRELVESQQNPAARSRLAAAFHNLSNCNQIMSSIDRLNRRRFRENLYKFLNDVRGFLRTC